MDEWDSLSVNLAFWDMCEYLYSQFSTVWFGPNSGFPRMTLFGQLLTVKGCFMTNGDEAFR